MQDNVRDLGQQQGSQPTSAHGRTKWWMIPVLTVIALPAPSWSQFNRPIVTEIASGGPVDWGANFSGDMLDVVWVAHPANNSYWDIWSSHRASIDTPWETPQPVDIVNTSRGESAPHLSDDGLTLTFASDERAGGYGGVDLWQTHRASRDAPWQEPVNMGPTINTRGNDGMATLSNDGLEIIFSSGCVGNGLCNPSTLRRSTRETLDDEWTTPERMTRSQRGDRLGAVLQHSLSPDGLSLYYSAPGSFGDLDVFVSKRPSLDALFGEGENLGATINTSGRDTGPRIAPDGSLYYGYGWFPGQTTLRIWRAEAESILGDFDNNGVLEISDIDELIARVAVGDIHTTYDLNTDATVDTEDIRVWIKDLFVSWIGDANLDREFNSGDMVEVFQAGKYELDVDASWAQGDWTGDRRFDSGDMVAAFQDGGYEQGPRTAANVVPESSSGILLAAGAFCIARIRKRKQRLGGGVLTRDELSGTKPARTRFRNFFTP